MRPALVAAVVLAGVLAACSTTDGSTRAPTNAPTTTTTTRGATDVHRTTLAYGQGPARVVDLAWDGAAEAGGRLPVVVLLHGGFWQQAYGRDLMAPLADDLVRRGYLTANVEYRRVGGAGGWPATFRDVAASIDALAVADAPVDPDRVVLVGHSAGGHLAAWAASRPALPAGAVGADPVVTPCGAVSQAGVLALARAARDDVGGTAVRDLMGGGPDEFPGRYDVGDPSRLAPPPVPTLLVHAEGDGLVPFGQSVAYAEAAGTGDVELRPVDGDHFTPIDPGDPSWSATVDWIGEHCR